MKRKMMRKFAMMLAASIFMTQVSYFPARAAEVTVEESDEKETESEIMAEIVAESEVDASTEEQTETTAATEGIAETEITTESSETETELITEIGTEVETESETEDSTEIETELTTEVETETETAEEQTEEQIENKDNSLSGISFSFPDIRDDEDALSKILNTDDEKQAVYVFGSFTTCSNTATAVKALSKCVTYYDKNKINMFVFDISRKSTQELASWVNSNKISDDVMVSSISSSISVNDFFQTCADMTIGSGGFTMPLIVYKGTNGEIYVHTTGYQTEAKICANIEAGGLDKITGAGDEDGKEKAGLLYVTSGVKYDIAYEILDIVNAEREKEGLPALVMDKDLLDAAMQRAVECQVYYASDHTRPDGNICFTASEKMNGENIAWGQSGAKQVMNAWMNSQGHRENILRAEFHSIGIGVANVGGRLAFTQCFGVGNAEELQKPSDIAAKTFEVRYIKSRIAPALTQSSVKLAQGGTHTIVIRTLNTPVSNYIDTIVGNSYTWKSSDETVATVDELGNVKGITAGKATITGTNVLNKEHTLTLEITVEEKKPNVSSVTLNNTSLQLKENETFQLIATVKSDISVDKVEWSSSNENVATVSEDGLVTANSEGTAVITAASYGKKATCNVKVEKVPEPLKTFIVTFDTDGGSAVEPLTVSENDMADEPIDPTKAGYHFAGWYLNGVPYDFGASVTADITLKAVWKEYDVLAAPTASLKSGMTIEAGTRVALSHIMPDAAIYYTTDNSTPTVQGTEYKNAIIIDKDIAIDNKVTIRAIAVKDGYKNSEIVEFHYTIAEKGSLWGDVSPEDIPDSDSIPKGIWVTGIRDATYTGKAVTHDIRVYDGRTLLVEKQDYTVSYKNNINAASDKDAKAPMIIITGKGNYSEKKTIPFTINPKNINDADVTADEITLAYTGRPLKAVPVLTYKQKKLANNRDFTITNPTTYNDAKKYTISVQGKGNYTGIRNITLTVTKKTMLNKASVKKIPNQTYDGKAKTPEITVKLKKELVLNQDYTLSYEDNKEIGTASVIITGKGEYVGTKRINFKIVSPYKGGKYDIDKDVENLVDVDIDSNVTFLKGGSTPAIRVSVNGKRLALGKDYTVSYKNHKAAYAASGKDATAIITGKGSYCGKIVKSFQIDTKDIADTILLVNDKTYTGKAKGHITKFTLTDVDGKELKANTDYEKEIFYTYANETTLENGEIRAAGDAVKDTDIIPVGTTIKVTITGKGSYKDTITGSYRVIAKENDISKAKVTLKTPQYYTGAAVEPDENQFEVKLGDKVLNANEYSITGYTNNKKKGNATVTIRGEGEYGGTKTARFAIGSKVVGTMEVK